MTEPLRVRGEGGPEVPLDLDWLRAEFEVRRSAGEVMALMRRGWLPGFPEPYCGRCLRAWSDDHVCGRWRVWWVRWVLARWPW